MKKIKILALSGKSGCGKDTIQKLLLNSYPADFHRIVSCTTRPKRDYEVEGEDYKFIHELTFLDGMMAGLFIEALEFNGWFYGSLIGALNSNKINIGIYTQEGLECLYESAAEFNLEILPIYIHTTDKARLIRILNRETDPDINEVFRRWQTDAADFDPLDDRYFIVHNQKEPMDRNYIMDIIINHCEDFFD